jgi:hypothetical protein
MNYKKLLIQILKGKTSRMKSNAHKLFFNNIMGYSIYDNYSFDKLTQISIDKYLSYKHGVKLNEA